MKNKAWTKLTPFDKNEKKILASISEIGNLMLHCVLKNRWTRECIQEIFSIIIIIPVLKTFCIPPTSFIKIFCSPQAVAAGHYVSNLSFGYEERLWCRRAFLCPWDSQNLRLWKAWKSDNRETLKWPLFPQPLNSQIFLKTLTWWNISLFLLKKTSSHI